MQIAVQIKNGNQNLFNAIKALLKTQPELDFKIKKQTKEVMKDSVVKELKTATSLPQYKSHKDLVKDLMKEIKAEQ